MLKTKIKTNSKSGAAARHKEKKRLEAIERNTKYQALPLEDKLSRHSVGSKVIKRLVNV